MCRRQHYSGIQAYIAVNKMSSKGLERQRSSLIEITSQLLPGWTSAKPRSSCRTAEIQTGYSRPQFRSPASRSFQIFYNYIFYHKPTTARGPELNKRTMAVNYSVTRNSRHPTAFTANNERKIHPPLLAAAGLSVAVGSNGFLAVWSTFFEAGYHHIGEYLLPPLAFGIPSHVRVSISTELVRTHLPHVLNRVWVRS
jgi:hypothetical protein